MVLLSPSQKLQVWDSRERRKAKEHEKQYEKEDERRGEMVCYLAAVLSLVTMCEGTQ